MNVFFILSAFLITRLLLAEQREFGWISVREFYRRRVRRLAPALLVLWAGVGRARDERVEGSATG